MKTPFPLEPIARPSLAIGLLVACLPLFVGACAPEPTCPADVYPMQYLETAPTPAEISAAPTEPPADPIAQIAGRQMSVDRLVRGVFCHDRWSGTVYVSCDVQVVKWNEDPVFLSDCDLEIAPGTVIYVAHHNDAPYYNGCSCHTGEEP